MTVRTLGGRLRSIGSYHPGAQKTRSGVVVAKWPNPRDGMNLRDADGTVWKFPPANTNVTEVTIESVVED